MSEIEKYYFDGDDGVYVKYSDYESLEEKVEELSKKHLKQRGLRIKYSNQALALEKKVEYFRKMMKSYQHDYYRLREIYHEQVRKEKRKWKK